MNRKTRNPIEFERFGNENVRKGFVPLPRQWSNLLTDHPTKRLAP